MYSTKNWGIVPLQMSRCLQMNILTKEFVLMCTFQTFENEGRYYECDFLPFMELGSVAHKYYLLNIRLPVNERKKINVGIGEIKDIRLVVSFLCDFTI